MRATPTVVSLFFQCKKTVARLRRSFCALRQSIQRQCSVARSCGLRFCAVVCTAGNRLKSECAIGTDVPFLCRLRPKLAELFCLNTSQTDAVKNDGIGLA